MRRLRLHRPHRPPPPTPAVEATESVPELPPPAQDAATAPTENVKPTGEAVEAPEQAGDAAEHTEQPEPLGSGMILVSRQPVSVLASPSASAPTMYGFPAGRPFRVIGHDGGFAHIQDLKAVRAAGLRRQRSAAATRSGRLGSVSDGPFAVRRKPTNPSADPKPKATKNDRWGLPTPKQPLNRTAGALAYLVEGVSSAASSATVTSLGHSGREPRVRLLRIRSRSEFSDQGSASLTSG